MIYDTTIDKHHLSLMAEIADVRKMIDRGLDKDNKPVSYDRRQELKPLLAKLEWYLKALEWYYSRKTHVLNIIKTANKAEEHTDRLVMRNPPMWRAEHWKWFLKERNIIK